MTFETNEIYKQKEAIEMLDTNISEISKEEISNLSEISTSKHNKKNLRMWYEQLLLSLVIPAPLLVHALKYASPSKQNYCLNLVVLIALPGLIYASSGKIFPEEEFNKINKEKVTRIRILISLLVVLAFYFINRS